VRVMGDIGGYEPRRATYPATLLDLVERALAQPDRDRHHHHSIELVEFLLAREGMTNRARGLTIQMGSYNVSAEVTRPWRERIRRLLVDVALKGSARERMATARLFDDALRLPHGYFGNTVDREARDSWHDDQRALPHAIGEIEANSNAPVLRDALSSIAGATERARGSATPACM
jgi:hypothetical protein